ncbi:hypothetical protein [Geopseudomonas aromaticivorans]
MPKIPLGKISGIHPDFARIEKELDLAPTHLPDRALVPKALVRQINTAYPLVITDLEGQFFCIGQTSLYRWLAAHKAQDTEVSCLLWEGRLTKIQIHQFVLTERLVAPALAQITQQQARGLFEHISTAQSVWPHEYRSHAHLAKIVGLKPLKGKTP